MYKLTNIAAAVSVALISLTGCGGSGSSSDHSVASTHKVKTGYFIDAEVKGLGYRTTSGKTGRTNKLGQFFYEAGDSVTFSIGKLTLGKATPRSDGLVTPRDLALVAAGKDHDRARNLENLMLRLLQSLDVDSNPKNGIIINPRLLNSLKNIEEVALADSNESDILDLNSDLRNDLDEDNDGRIDVDEARATAHAEQSFNNWKKGIKPKAAGHQTVVRTKTKTKVDTVISSVLTHDQKYSLAYMWNEERLAKDIYLALNDIYPAKPLEDIATKSETKHIDAIESLVKKYDINILNLVDYSASYSKSELKALPAGTYGVDAIQRLYDTLYEKGVNSKIDAFQVACMVEVTDVDDLDAFINVADKVGAQDLVAVYGKLRAGSYNHYWAFDKALKAEGVAEGCASAGAEYAKTKAEYPGSGDGKGYQSNQNRSGQNQNHQSGNNQSREGQGHLVKNIHDQVGQNQEHQGGNNQNRGDQGRSHIVENNQSKDDLGHLVGNHQNRVDQVRQDQDRGDGRVGFKF